MKTADTPAQLRQLIRAGDFTGNTSGLMPGYVQCNLVIVPEAYANDFEQFCQINAQACPLLAKSFEPGNPFADVMGSDINICTDLPEYQLFIDGNIAKKVHDIREFWQPDFVYFLLGCSFSFEEALLEAGIEVRNISEQKNVPMYRTIIPCQSSGVFQGNLVVSMRPMTPADALRAKSICAQYPKVHGEPVAIGQPETLGITDLNNPDFGDAVSIKAGEVPVFWACGVTPQLALASAKLPISISHSPGCMLVTDVLNAELKNYDS